jgi:hypothetical protein
LPASLQHLTALEQSTLFEQTSARVQALATELALSSSAHLRDRALAIDM